VHKDRESDQVERQKGKDHSRQNIHRERVVSGLCVKHL
jgi:hypothetical protein